ncbi:MAG: YaiI/YqxD family protein [Sphaerochaetaceae bacterium]|jgi:uncharacterized protein YaiI (UPF0178 family)
MSDYPLLYIDADSCPRQLRTIILKAVQKRQISALFVADRPLNDVIELENSLGSSLIRMHVVTPGDDSADDYLVQQAQSGTLAITRDIPLADRLVEKDLTVIDDRGNVYTKESVKERLSLRNMMSDLRELGIFVEKTKPMGRKEIKAFSDALDRHLTRLITKQTKQ